MKFDRDTVNLWLETEDHLKKRVSERLNRPLSRRSRLSDSALGTAVAVFALHCGKKEADRELITLGLAWIRDNANADGGWGDSPDSISNVSTTLLCWGTLSLAVEYGIPCEETEKNAVRWLENHFGSQITPRTIASVILAKYGKDKTFSVPILTMLACTGRLGIGDDVWKLIPQLPFELALLPPALFRFLGLPVVSYALPALISIGLLTFRMKKRRRSPLTAVRRTATARVLQRLEKMQPESGGFLEAQPLTGFTVICLCRCGYLEHPVTRKGLGFLRSTAGDNGNWPIDTNLSLWITSIGLAALGSKNLADDQKEQHINEIRRYQTTARHPFNQAAPGGWGWTDLSGAVPDADDTSGALLALADLSGTNDRQSAVFAENGLRWLSKLQNADGGIPTFCRGWTRLPFDASSPDITAHMVKAFQNWRAVMPPGLQRKIDRSVKRAVRYLINSQRPEGCWIPLWFGNQAETDHTNPVYGTSRVISALKTAGLSRTTQAVRKGEEYLWSVQNKDGGWGGGPSSPSSMEETGLALTALTLTENNRSRFADALNWLAETDEGNPPPRPIGLYFASLWYSEEAYTEIFALAGLKEALRQWGAHHKKERPLDKPVQNQKEERLWV